MHGVAKEAKWTTLSIIGARLRAQRNHVMVHVVPIPDQASSQRAYTQTAVCDSVDSVIPPAAWG